ncbi:MAG: sigma-70 family RNA polymerase sigma factor [Bacteroidota bacterium]
MLKKKETHVYEDQELIQGLMQEGAQREIWVARLFDQHKGMALQGKRKHNISLEDARDAYSDAVISVSRQIQQGKFRGDSKLSTWFYQVFRNYCIKRFHKAKRQQIDWADEMPNLPETAQNMLETLIEKDQFDTLYEWMGQLGENCRQILVLREFHQYTPKEIAEKIGFKNAQSVSSKRFKCLEKLRELIFQTKTASPFLPSL